MGFVGSESQSRKTREASSYREAQYVTLQCLLSQALDERNAHHLCNRISVSCSVARVRLLTLVQGGGGRCGSRDPLHRWVHSSCGWGETQVLSSPASSVFAKVSSAVTRVTGCGHVLHRASSSWPRCCCVHPVPAFRDARQQLPGAGSPAFTFPAASAPT